MLINNTRIVFLLFPFTIGLLSGSQCQASAYNIPPTVNVASYSTMQKEAGDSGEVRKEKPVAVLLAVTVGILGVHRIYLGSSVLTMVAYPLTLGGGVVVWIMDVVKLIAAKDISEYVNNPNFIMWRK